MNKFKTAKKVINGVEYVAQFSGVGLQAEAIDSCYMDGTNITSDEKLAQFLLDNVIVEPKLKINDFGADKIGEEQTKTINGVEYTAKFGGLLNVSRMKDSCYIDGTQNISLRKMNKYVLDHAFVKPENISEDDFEDADTYNKVIAFGREAMEGGEVSKTFNEVIEFATEVMMGTYFRQEADRQADKGKGKK